MNRSLGEYTLLQSLGEGGFGVVWLAEKDGRRYAIKILTHTAEEVMERFAKEALRVQELMTQERLPWVVEVVEFLPAHRAYVMEYCPESLAEYVQRTHDTSPLENLILAVAELHRRNIAHRDLKPENVRVRGTTPVILDFGIASWQDSRSQYMGVGTLPYSPPEALFFQPGAGQMTGAVAKEAFAQLINIPGTQQHRIKRVKMLHDVFSLGLTLGTILTGRHPFLDEHNHLKEKEVKTFLEKGSSPGMARWLEEVPDSFRGLVKDALEPYPLSRPLAEQLLRRHLPHLLRGMKRPQILQPDEAEFACLDCGALTAAPAKYCQNCGAPLAVVALHILPTQPVELAPEAPIRLYQPHGGSPLFDQPTLLCPVDSAQWELTLGRQAGCSIVFPTDHCLSRRHGRFRYANGVVSYTDGVIDSSGSLTAPTNRSTYNTVPVGERPVVLEAGASLVTGGTMFLINKLFSRDLPNHLRTGRSSSGARWYSLR